MRIIENVRSLRNNFKNWLSLGLSLNFSKKTQLKAVSRTGQSYNLWRNYFFAIVPLLKKGMPADEIIQNLLKDRIPCNDDFIVIHGWIGENNQNNGNIFDVFIKEEYKFLNVKGRICIDIGASIGDSPIYFALNGATKVIGLEPYPYTFNFGVRNIKENGLDQKIIFLNAGYGLDGEILVDENKVSTDAMDLQQSKIGKKISTYSLKTLVNKFKLDKVVLKMDCEGCEYALLNEDEEVFNHIEMIQIEYHYGYEDLVKKLKNCGFNVKFTEPRKSYTRNASNLNKEIGYIYAERISSSKFDQRKIM
ncbi:MAG: FkbM family methyltransferase [Candidatus Thermoplasmatota archaeon]|jgi:FkbM family methyltransferase|nr:FkbM family methyltransferase [Candidatus Thermoplasmatota archaeon]